MDVKAVIAKLSPLERRVLPLLSILSSFDDILAKSGLKGVEIMRALQWLGNKKIIVLKEDKKEVIDLGKNGKEYVKKGLPEKRFLEAVNEKDLSLDGIGEEVGLSKDELDACVGVLKKKAAINLKKDKKLIISITDNGKKLLLKKSLEEEFLEKQFPVEVSGLKPEEKFAFENLIKRKDILKEEVVKLREVELTLLGKKIIKKGISDEKFIDRLTSGLLKTGKWRKKNFRAYDVEINVPKAYYGKRHFVNDAIDYVKKIWLEMGFTEMTGKLVDSSFWNFDALFTSQDHPVRDLQDTFFIKDIKSELKDKGIVERVKKTHEDGWTTGSIGWRYDWSLDEAKKNVLRTHTTVLSVREIAKLRKEDLPAKFFSVGKCFRNESLDWSHLFELVQVEGIVVDENVNFSNLMGYLKEFFGKMGFEKIRVRPAYFPYTEPSAEVDIFHPVKKKWVELGGAGIFRPEVVKPLLGVDYPVLAWGIGLERTVSDYYDISDIREIYKNDLKQTRNMKAWLK
ncbi:phenylalanine--tRNA ligase subunit alpha [Candidatus Woesearchaeota archaeon]|jgi:phenylalanyl-tRNA synthetase alpha chain|nr:phenylalanine--tRNA ligase subunit alpha [Candidatus Woesearchaeota archaeon]